MNSQELNLDLVQKVIKVVEKGLTKGLGIPEPGSLCVEAAVCYAYGIPHSDNPPCVGENVRSFKIALNDCDWSSKEARAKGMIRLSIAQLNSNVLNQSEFYDRLRLKIVNNIISKIANKYAPELEEEFKAINNINKLWDILEKLDNILVSGGFRFGCSDYLYFDVVVAVKVSELLELPLDDILNQYSNACLDVLIEMKSPGCEYLLDKSYGN